MTYQQFPIIGPFGGYQDNLPEPHTPKESFRELRNFLVRKGRLESRPRLNVYLKPPDGSIIRNMVSFKDITGFSHTVVLTTRTAYALTTGPVWNALTLPSPLTTLDGTALPYALLNTQRRLFFCNGSTKLLHYDGEAEIKVAGDTPGGCRFLATNAFHLIQAYTTEAGVKYPYRVRWSKSGDPLDWTSFTSGFEDLLEVSDEITGLATLGRSTYVFRTNGITVMTPTGLGLNPFQFDNLSSASLGVGNTFPYTLAVFNDRAMFVAANDIYLVSPGNLQAVGGKAKRAIYTDLLNGVGDVPVGFPLARMGIGRDYLSYWLSIANQRTWIYHFDEDNWTTMVTGAGRLTALNSVILPAEEA